MQAISLQKCFGLIYITEILLEKAENHNIIIITKEQLFFFYLNDKNYSQLAIQIQKVVYLKFGWSTKMGQGTR